MLSEPVRATQLQSSSEGTVITHAISIAMAWAFDANVDFVMYPTNLIYFATLHALLSFLSHHQDGTFPDRTPPPGLAAVE